MVKFVGQRSKINNIPDHAPPSAGPHYSSLWAADSPSAAASTCLNRNSLWLKHINRYRNHEYRNQEVSRTEYFEQKNNVKKRVSIVDICREELWLDVHFACSIVIFDKLIKRMIEQNISDHARQYYWRKARERVDSEQRNISQASSNTSKPLGHLLIDHPELVDEMEPCELSRAILCHRID